MLVYVVDDEKFILKLLERSLKRDSHKVISLNSGVEFIAKFPNLQKPDVIILDIVMPGLSGIDVYDKINTYYNSLKENIPYIVFMSAYDQSGLLTKYINNTDIWFIPKPFGITELRSVFSEIDIYQKKQSSGVYPIRKQLHNKSDNPQKRLS